MRYTTFLPKSGKGYSKLKVKSVTHVAVSQKNIYIQQQAFFGRLLKRL